MVRVSIINEVKESEVFAIMADETKDTKKKEQISLVLRYYYQGAVKESFLHFEAAEHLDAAGLTEKIIHILEKYGLDYRSNLVGQAYDGASVMSVELVGQTEPVVALTGDDVILLCSLKPASSAVDQSVLWTRPDLILDQVHLYRNKRVSNADQNPSYKGRTSLSKEEELKKGNISLKLSRVKLSDAGIYRCSVPSLGGVKEAEIQLDVGAVSQPVISVVGPKDYGVVLKCDSGGWFPKPEMTWVDSDGNILPDGSTETETDSEGRYTVRGHVTVQKTDMFTCRVQQQKINHKMETEINVPGEV
ncbi:butyrophilin subfamily 1 member A1-like, partial [Esox lucius]|uniref:butyrophilin subfamily 1 member A1-like n=1 Tax=Esox lucius TaxID=8010 RepID=UPI0014769CD8